MISSFTAWTVPTDRCLQTTRPGLVFQLAAFWVEPSLGQKFATGSWVGMNQSRRSPCTPIPDCQIEWHVTRRVTVLSDRPRPVGRTCAPKLPAKASEALVFRPCVPSTELAH